VWCGIVGGLSVGSAQHRPQEQRWPEDATRPADPDGEARGQHLPHEQHENEGDHIAPRDRPLEDRISDAVHLGEREQKDAEQQSPGGRPEALTPWPEAIAHVLDGVEHPVEADAHNPGEDPEAEVEGVLRH
jgi:hypothetical protein